MRRWGLSVMGVLVVAGAAASMAVASSASTTTVVKALEKNKVVINKYIQSGNRYSPGTVTVKSGSLLTFKFGDNEQDVHTLTIAPKSQLPHTVAQVNACNVCRLALAHLKNPTAPPGPSNPVVNWILHAGKPAANASAGLSVPGDSIAIESGGAHSQISIRVTAKPGTTLNFFCAVHPWMQGKIKVT